MLKPACILYLFLLTFLSPHLVVQTNLSTAKNDAGVADRRDGQHDFDFDFGTWKTHLKRLLHPLTGSTTWAEYDGTTVVRKLWNGRSNLVELVANGPAGHFEGMSLRLYNPQAHQWSLNFSALGSGSLTQPTIGEFKEGRGEFYDQETLSGRAILVRFVISDMTPNSCHFEQAFSDDGGKSWEVNWIADDTRISEEFKAKLKSSSTDVHGEHDFDFEGGSWKIHLKRRLHPLTGSNTWVEFDGTSATQPVWNGRAWIEEFDTSGPSGPVQGMTLRLFNPQSHQWSLYWANAKSGALGGPPNVGEFRNSTGEFYCQDTYNGKMILIRYLWSNITPTSAHFEQSFSEDGGKNWEVNWITDQTRVKEAT